MGGGLEAVGFCICNRKYLIACLASVIIWNSQPQCESTASRGSHYLNILGIGCTYNVCCSAYDAPGVCIRVVLIALVGPE